ncbi:MAG: DUF1819 family protein, partial [Campylobacterota bacterium]|nr:DUF1819 family protein [Campylobacterota bacterium]
VEEDALQKNTIATRKRYFRELKQRIELYTDDELKYFEEASMEEMRQLAFVGCLKRYRFLKEFLFEVIREKYLSFDYQIENSDYVSFYESKMTLSPNLSKASEATLKKLKQVMFKMFADIALIDSTKNHYIIKPMLSERIIQLVYNDDPMLLQALLLNNDEIMYYAGAKQ